jgi:hypothetical protein
MSDQEGSGQSIEVQARALMILLGAFVSGVVIFAAVAFAIGPLWYEMDEDMQDTANLLAYIAAGVAVMTIGPAFLFYSTQLKRLATQESENERMATYRGMAIFVGAITEGAALFCIVVLLLTGTAWVAAVGLVVFLVFIGLIFPTSERINTHVLRQTKDKYS